MSQPPFRVFGALLASGLLAACGAGPSRDTSAGVDPVNGAPSADPAVRVGAITARDLPSGQCGLFLWRRTDDPQLVFFFNSTTGRAAVAVDGQERALTRVEVTDGTDGAGEQVFATQGGQFAVRVAIHEREEIPDGVRIARAVVRVSDDRGWSAVIGAGGLAACQP